MRRALTLGAMLVILLLGVFPAPKTVLAADQEGSTQLTGKVTVSLQVPQISFTFYSDSDYTTSTNDFTPQSPVYLKISVTTNNELQQFKIVFHMYYDSDNTKVGKIPTDTPNPETYIRFTIEWDSDSNQWSLTSEGTGATWDISFDNSKSLPSPTDPSGDFYLVVVPGKTAREANNGAGATDDWDAVANVSAISDPTIKNSNYASGYRMYFYSEITTTEQTIDFGNVLPGASQHIVMVDETSTDHFTVTIIANGYYNIKIVSDPQWSGTESPEHVITLTTGTPSAGEFKLVADDAASSGFPTNEHVVGSDTSSSEGLLETSGLPTDESGVSHNIYMKITLGDNIYADTYTGTLTVYAVNG